MKDKKIADVITFCSFTILSVTIINSCAVFLASENYGSFTQTGLPGLYLMWSNTPPPTQPLTLFHHGLILVWMLAKWMQWLVHMSVCLLFRMFDYFKISENSEFFILVFNLKTQSKILFNLPFMLLTQILEWRLWCLGSYHTHNFILI